MMLYINVIYLYCILSARWYFITSVFFFSESKVNFPAPEAEILWGRNAPYFFANISALEQFFSKSADINFTTCVV